MICLRCGHCCKTYVVVIVDDPEKGIVDDNLIGHIGDGPCKHLEGDKPGNYSCKLHNYPWYKETPCYQYGQIEADPSDECRTGRWMLDHLEESRWTKDFSSLKV